MTSADFLTDWTKDRARQWAKSGVARTLVLYGSSRDSVFVSMRELGQRGYVLIELAKQVPPPYSAPR